MASLLEMAKDIVAAHAQTTPMTTEELLAEIRKVYAALQALESGTAEEAVISVAEEPVSLTVRQAFKANEVICMICGKGKMKSLTRHLNMTHEMKPVEYRKQFNIPKSLPLMSKGYAAKRKEIAAGMDLKSNLEKARAARKGAAVKTGAAKKAPPKKR
jgi:predicted transcriptional regulator